MSPEQKKIEQDKMIEDLMNNAPESADKNWLQKINSVMWPECSTCAGWRGVLIGFVLAILVGFYV